LELENLGISTVPDMIHITFLGRTTFHWRAHANAIENAEIVNSLSQKKKKKKKKPLGTPHHLLLSTNFFNLQRNNHVYTVQGVPKRHILDDGIYFGMDIRALVGCSKKYGPIMNKGCELNSFTMVRYIRGNEHRVKGFEI
jgi:hypothetical protein